MDKIKAAKAECARQLVGVLKTLSIQEVYSLFSQVRNGATA